MRVLLTGGSGFIGRNLRERLAGACELLAPAHAELDLEDGDAVARFLRERPVDAVVHAATVPGHRNAPSARDLAIRNLRMFFHLVRSAPEARFVVLGSGAEYGTSRDVVRAREDAAHPIPSDETGFSKWVMSAWARERERFVHLRPFGVYGPGEDWEIRFLSNALCKALHGLPITLRQNRRLDYVFVGDLCEVVARFLAEGAGAHRVYNVTPDATPDLLAIAHLAREVAGADVPIHVAREGTGLEYTGDNARLLARFAGFAFTTIREGAGRLCAHYREHLPAVAREKLLVDK